MILEYKTFHFCDGNPRRVFDGFGALQIPYLAGSSEIKDIRALFSAEVRLGMYNYKKYD
jgi:hypothetical protein